MHVLTKVFIVLVALLAVMLVPLVVVYAKNENNYKARYLVADLEMIANKKVLSRAMETNSAALASKDNEIARLNEQLLAAQAQSSSTSSQLARTQADLTSQGLAQTQMNSRLSVLVTTMQAGQVLTESIVKEAGQLRDDALALTRSNAELDERLREQDRSLEYAESAIRHLEEEVQRLSEANDRATETIGVYVASFGEIRDAARAGGVGAPLPDRNISADIIDVRQDSGITFAEINAGQRDGLKEGMILTIGDGAGGFIGKLEIVNVDINRATGVAKTVFGDPAPVRLGHRASARAR